MPEPGDRVRVRTPKETVEGLLMPTPEYQADILVLKLDSGYNVGIDRKTLSSVELVSSQRDAHAATRPREQKKNLPLITVLHTGGTIASKVDYKTGGVVARFSPEELLGLFPELGDIAQVRSRLVRNMWSEDMRFPHYNLLAEEVAKEARARGVIITHGTDTLHYSAAALAFALENINIPVLLVGAQRSSDRGSSDAGMNLLSAARFIAANTGFHGVAPCMHASRSDDDCWILPPCRTRKMHTSRRDAFRPVNAGPLARVRHGKVTILDRSSHHFSQPGPFRLRPFQDVKVGLLKAHTNMFASEWLAYKGFHGLVVEATGLGQAPVNEIDAETKEHAKIRAALKELLAETVVAFAPQTIYGRLNMDVYQPARELQDLGVLGHLCDMTPETAFIKLAWLLSNEPKRVRELYAKDLRGELRERSEPERFLV